MSEEVKVYRLEDLSIEALKELLETMSKAMEEKETQNVLFTYEGDSFESVKEALINIFEFQIGNLEGMKHSSSDITISVKNTPKEVRLDFFKYVLSRKDIIDRNTILNVFNFIKGYNSFEESFYSSEVVFVNKLIEYVDIKKALKPDLEKLVKDLAIYYLSIMKSCSTDRITDDMVVIPLMYQRLLFISDFYTLSLFLNSSEGINIDKDLLVVNNPMAFVYEWSKKQCMTKEFMALVDIIQESNKVENKE